MERLKKLGPAIRAIKDEHRGKDAKGTTACPICGGTLHYWHHAHNEHVWLKCETEGCIWMME